MPSQPVHAPRLASAAIAALTVAAAVLGCSADTNDPAGNSSSESATAEADPGSRPEDPYPPGTEVEVADWTVQLSNLRFDVTDEVLESDPYGYGIGPSPGNAFATFAIEATYNGAGSSALWYEFTFGAWTDGAFYLPCPATTVDDIYETPEVSSGKTVSGTICIEIPTGVDDVVPYLEELDSNQARTFIAIDPDAPEEAPTDGTSSAAPLPAGSTAEIGNWQITPSNLHLDAISAGDPDFYGELPADRQIVTYDVTGTYTGTGIVSIAFEIEVGIWADGAFYPEDCEATFPGYWADAPDVENGGTAAGTACAEIPADITDSADLLFYVSVAEDLTGPVYYIQTG